MAIGECLGPELLEPRKIFKQPMKEPVNTRLVSLWDTGTDMTSLGAAEAKELSKVTIHQCLRQGLQDLRKSSLIEGISPLWIGL